MKHHCTKCEYEWDSRVDKPKACPSCKRYHGVVAIGSDRLFDVYPRLAPLPAFHGDAVVKSEPEPIDESQVNGLSLNE